MYGTGASYYSFCNDFHSDFNAYNYLDTPFLLTETNCRSFSSPWETAPQSDAGSSGSNVSPFVFPNPSGKNSFTVYQDLEQPKRNTHSNSFTVNQDVQQLKVTKERNNVKIYHDEEQIKYNNVTLYKDLEHPKHITGCDQVQLLSCSSHLSSSLRPASDKNVLESPHYNNEISRDGDFYCFGNLNSFVSACSEDSSQQNCTRHHYCPSYVMNNAEVDNDSTALRSLKNYTATEKALHSDLNYSCMQQKQKFDCLKFVTASTENFNHLNKNTENSTDFQESCAKSVKRSRRHIPHALRPTDAVVRRNNREKRRIGNVNAAFEVLRRSTPLVKLNKKAPKISILRHAAQYIAELTEYLANTPKAALT